MEQGLSLKGSPKCPQVGQCILGVVQGAWKGNQHQPLLVTICSGFGTEKTFHIVKAFQDFWLVGAFRVLFFLF